MNQEDYSLKTVISSPNLILRYMKLVIKRGKETIATGSVDYQDIKAAQKAAKEVIKRQQYKGCYVQIDKQV